MEIISGLYVIKGRAANCYLINKAGELSLIDTGLPGNHKHIIAYLEGLDFQIQQLKQILITHADGDHYGSLSALKKISGAKVYASPIEAQAIQEGIQSRPLKLQGLKKFLFRVTYPLFKPKAVPVDHLLEEGKSLPTFGGLRVIPTPGHTPGHISLFAEQHKLLFVGDSLRATGDGILLPSRGANTWDEDRALASVRLQADLKPEIVCPGNGPIIFKASDKFPQ
jgi:glyoxylase-like metal-dependent hydrolase (beta-lactamase superfamily II)